MKPDERKMMRELEEIVEDIEEYAELYREEDDWHVEGEKAPVDIELAQYALEPEERFLGLWKDTGDAARRDGSALTEGDYCDLNERIWENQDFIEEVYEMDKPLGRAKIQVKYS